MGNSKQIIDLRSDTVTKPSPEMWEAVKAIANDDSRLGDDVYREDEYVNALEEKIAKMSGKEAGLFVTSGSQANFWAPRGAGRVVPARKAFPMMVRGNGGESG